MNTACMQPQGSLADALYDAFVELKALEFPSLAEAVALARSRIIELDPEASMPEAEIG